jgi:hypothetical protein
MKEKRDDRIVLFVRDAKTGRYVFNAEALEALGVDPAKASQYGYDSLSFRLPGVSTANADHPEPSDSR